MDRGADASPSDAAMDRGADASPSDAATDRGADASPSDAATDQGSADAPSSDAGLPAAARAQIDGYCALRARAICDGDIACQRIAPTTATACVARQQDRCVNSLLDSVSYRTAENIARGVLRIDMDAARRCFEVGATNYCRTNNIEFESSACQRIFVGSLRNGEVCDVGFGQGSGPCAEGFCPLFPATCPARCTAYTSAGMPCDDNPVSSTRCAPGLVCLMRRCTAPAGLGMPCTGGCAEGLVCVTPVGASSSTCARPAAVGSPCVVPFGCASGLCAEGRCAERATAAGQRCEYATHCPAGLGCYDSMPGSNIVNTCQTPLGAGAACDPEASRCGPGLSCASGSRVCAAPPEAGQPCVEGNCALGLTCVLGTCGAPAELGARCNAASPVGECRSPTLHCGRDGTCRSAGSQGAPCRTDAATSCAAGFYCADGDRCAPSLAAGSPCLADRVGQCSAGLGCLSGRCTLLLARGSACTEASSCAEGTCLEGRCVWICPRLR